MMDFGFTTTKYYYNIPTTNNNKKKKVLQLTVSCGVRILQKSRNHDENLTEFPKPRRSAEMRVCWHFVS